MSQRYRYRRRKGEVTQPSSVPCTEYKPAYCFGEQINNIYVNRKADFFRRSDEGIYYSFPTPMTHIKYHNRKKPKAVIMWESFHREQVLQLGALFGFRDLDKCNFAIDNIQLVESMEELCDFYKGILDETRPEEGYKPVRLLGYTIPAVKNYNLIGKEGRVFSIEKVGEIARPIHPGWYELFDFPDRSKRIRLVYDGATYEHITVDEKGYLYNEYPHQGYPPVYRVPRTKEGISCIYTPDKNTRIKQFHAARAVLESWERIQHVDLSCIAYKDLDYNNYARENMVYCYTTNEKALVYKTALKAMFPGEQWEIVPDQRDRYLVSDMGRFFSVTRVRIMKVRVTSIFPGFASSYGYIIMNKKNHYAHRVVLHAFVGYCPYDHQVDHANKNTLDNRLSNLEYVTASENMRRKYQVHEYGTEFNELPTEPEELGATWENIGIFLGGGDLSKYEVSDNGSVRRADDKMSMTLCLTPKGYVTVCLQPSNASRKKYPVHRLVAYVFHGPDYDTEKTDVNHINSVRDDNRASNLEWVTRKDNIIHGRGIDTVVKVIRTGEVFIVPSISQIPDTFKTEHFNLRRLHKGKSVQIIGEVRGEKEELYMQIASEYHNDSDSSNDEVEDSDDDVSDKEDSSVNLYDKEDSSVNLSDKEDHNVKASAKEDSSVNLSDKDGDSVNMDQLQEEIDELYLEYEDSDSETMEKQDV